MSAAAELIPAWLILSGGVLILLALPAAIAEWWRGRRAPRSTTPADPCPLLGPQRAVRHAMSYHRGTMSSHVYEWGDDLPTPLVNGRSLIRGKSIEEIAHKLIVETGGRTW